MDWEGGASEAPGPRRRWPGLLAVVAAVALVAWLVRSPDTAVDPAELAVDGADATAPATEQGSDAPADPPPERVGRWVQLPPPASAGPVTPAAEERVRGDAPAAGRLGAELVLVRGAAVLAHDPVRRTWRTLPDYPGATGIARTVTEVDGGLLVAESDIDPSRSARAVGLWLLAPDETWRRLPLPPTADLPRFAAHRGGIVAIGTPTGAGRAPAVALWTLVEAAGTWEALPDLPLRLSRAHAFDTTAGLIVLGSVTSAVPIEDPGTARAFVRRPGEEGWTALADPPGYAVRTQAVAVPATGAPADITATPRANRIVLLGGTLPGRPELAVLDVDQDRWTTRALDGVVEDPPDHVPPTFAAGWDGAGTVWFRSFGRAGALVALDLPADEVSVAPRPPRPAGGAVPLAFPGALYLVGGALGGAAGEDDPGDADVRDGGPRDGPDDHGSRVQRWTDGEGPLDTRPDGAQAAAPLGAAGMVGLGGVLPVVAGTWREVLPPGSDPSSSAGRPPLTTWDGARLIVVRPPAVHARDAAASTWERLPDLPAEAGDGAGLQLAAGDGGLVAVRALAVTPSPVPPRDAPAWVLPAGAAAWTALEGVPDAVLLGVVDLTGRGAASDPPGPGPHILLAEGTATATGPLSHRLWAVPVAGGDAWPLPDLPVDMLVGDVIDVPDGVVVRGARVAGGSGSPADPFQAEPVAARWVDGAWVALELPDLDLDGTRGVWVPSSAGAHEGGAPGALVLPGARADGPGLAIALLDLATGDWTVVPVPLTEQIRSRDPRGGLSAAWDGADAVWVHGGSPASVQLALDLTTGELATALPADLRRSADLRWDGEGLLLIGGTGPAGRDGRIQRWTPDG